MGLGFRVFAGSRIWAIGLSEIGGLIRGFGVGFMGPGVSNPHVGVHQCI